MDEKWGSWSLFEASFFCDCFLILILHYTAPFPVGDRNRWGTDNANGSPRIVEMAPPPAPQEQFHRQPSYVGNNYPPPTVQRSFSHPVRPSSSMPSIFEEHSPNLSNSSQVCFLVYCVHVVVLFLCLFIQIFLRLLG